MADKNEETEINQEEKAISFAEFLESTPPSKYTLITDLGEQLGRVQSNELFLPEIQLHCANDACNGIRFFRCVAEELVVPVGILDFVYLKYCCSNCQISEKIFSLAVRISQSKKSGRCYKFGEAPPYGPPTPPRLISLIGPDRETFLMGRRCENQGLGIGAFAYYRRVVENQKNRILDEIIKVSQKLSLPPEKIGMLEKAKAENQFSKALSDVKDALPQSLLINGHNPLTLLHSALSEGLHGKSDEACLEIAHDVRVVLSELSERLAQALKDEAELNQAISRLQKKD